MQPMKGEVHMDLFDSMPRLEGERVLLREMVDADAPALDALSKSESVYRMLPTFLYEQKYEDKHEAIANMRAECFDTRDSILLAVCLREAPDQMIGIAEIYAYEARKPKASIGCRLSEQYWGQGLATEAAKLLKAYLIDEVQVRTITAHVMTQNVASGQAMEKSGFVKLYTNVWEDWGRGEPVLIDKYVYKRRWGTAGPAPEELEKR